MTAPRICIIGSANMDLVVRAPRLPSPGETLLGGSFATSPGGKGANQAVAAARLGASVSFVGRVGDEDHGRALHGVLAAEKIDTSHLRTTEAAATGIALITVAESGENTIIVAPGANAALTTADIDAARDRIRDADVLLMQLEIPLPVVAHAAAAARELGTTVILNAAPAQRLPADLLACLDVLVINETEAAVIAQTGPAHLPLEPMEALMLRVSGLGIMSTIMTIGDQGSLYTHSKEPPGRVPACHVEAIDTVGAGDAFCGTLAVRLAEHQIGGHIDRMAVMDAVCWACAAGGLATTRHGAIPSLPTRTEVIRLLRQTC